MVNKIKCTECKREVPEKNFYEDRFVKEMKGLVELSEGGDIENCHMQADGLLCDLLEELGYGELVEIYHNVEKWYS